MSGTAEHTEGIERWWSEGEHVRLAVGGRERDVFVRRMGSGAPLTLLHGFPSSSHDWAKVAPRLAERHALLMPDFLGFGASEKPSQHEYSLHEQTDLVEALWAHEQLASTALVGHDYAVSVVEELLAREREGALTVGLERVTLLNGGLYPDLHRPQPTQLALLDPQHGPQLSGLITEEAFVAGLAPTFADAFDASADGAQIWRSMSRDDGHRNLHLLIRYISDRERHAQRWVSALESSSIPRGFVWGMLDPVSGAHMAERIRERLGAAPFTELADVSHWPQLEAPERVAQALLATV
jgi:pimeloyl-ACP methyl ester carboxylesterase